MRRASGDESHTSSEVYINTKKVVEQTAASSLGNHLFYCFILVLATTVIFLKEECR